MGFLESLTGRRHPIIDVEAVQLLPCETEIARAHGCVTKNGIPWVGGDLILTNQRLILTPVNTAELVRITKLGLKVIRIPNAGTVMMVIGTLQKLVKQTSADTVSITEVTVGRLDASLLKPPTILVHRAGNQPIEFGVLASQTSPNASRKNVLARDDFLRILKGEVRSQQ